jgi:hypothetical protein
MTRPATNGTRRNGAARCAIYTRKSSEKGLEQEFNSLQAQRDACEAFIAATRFPPATRSLIVWTESGKLPYSAAEIP